MSVTVEIRGTQAGGGGGANNIPTGGSTGGAQSSGILPADERMIADVRREMQSRGVLYVPGSQGFSQIVGQYRKQLSDQAQQGVEREYQPRWDALEKKREAGYRKIDREVYDFYREGLESADPEERKRAQEAADKAKKDKYARWVDTPLDKEAESLRSEEEAAKSRVETELTDAIKRLTDAIERDSKNEPEVPDSYIGRLRAQQKDLIKERDTAKDEAGAIDASKRLAEVNEKLRRAVAGEEGGKGGDGWGVALSGMRGVEQFLGAAGGGNLAGMISGVGGAGVGIASAAGGLSMASAATIMGVVAALAAVAGGIQSGAQTYDQISKLAGFRATTGGYYGREGGMMVGPLLRNSSFLGTGVYDIARMGLNDKEFASEAERRIRARGMSDDWFNETYRQIGMERSFALREGALMGAGAYDRYGMTGTEALSRLANTLINIQGSGVSVGDFTRVQEKLDVQQQIMGSYMSRADRPNYDIANRTVAALSAVRGITQDPRIGQDYAVMQGALQNPMNDRMKALVYGTIEDIIPGTRGRMDKVDAALRNPDNEGKILQAVIQRVTQMYGGMDTQMGYFAFRSIFPGIAPDRLEDYVKEFGNPNSEAAKRLMGALRTNEGEGFTGSQMGESTRDRMTKQGAEYTSAVTGFLQDIANDVGNIWARLSGNYRTGVEDAGSGTNGNRSAQ